MLDSISNSTQNNPPLSFTLVHPLYSGVLYYGHRYKYSITGSEAKCIYVVIQVLRLSLRKSSYGSQFNRAVGYLLVPYAVLPTSTFQSHYSHGHYS